MSTVIRKLWNADLAVYSPDCLLKTVWKLFPSFVGFKQQVRRQVMMARGHRAPLSDARALLGCRMPASTCSWCWNTCATAWSTAGPKSCCQTARAVAQRGAPARQRVAVHVPRRLMQALLTRPSQPC